MPRISAGAAKHASDGEMVADPAARAGQISGRRAGFGIASYFRSWPANVYRTVFDTTEYSFPASWENASSGRIRQAIAPHPGQSMCSVSIC
jgi:hypothetical protein